ncbi:MAG: hypothetical protein FD149_963 [Rhodospirillaceae bacterium]|nr:MAG: hypothetical protein FD149_963 [Rhodospirillaceae bacterium]
MPLRPAVFAMSWNTVSGCLCGLLATPAFAEKGTGVPADVVRVLRFARYGHNERNTGLGDSFISGWIVDAEHATLISALAPVTGEAGRNGDHTPIRP